MSDKITTVGETLRVPLERIRVFEGQPRTDFDDIEELANSIKTVGQAVPAEVRRLDDGSGYDFELIAGERRFRACKLKKIPTLFVIVVEIKNRKHQFELSFVENFCRKDLGHIEAAFSMAEMAKNGRSVKEIADIAGCDQARIYQHLNLLKLSPEVQAMIDSRGRKKAKLNFSIAYHISTRIPKDRPELQLQLAGEIIEKNLRTTQAKRYIDKRVKELDLVVKKDGRQAPRKDFSSFVNFFNKIEEDLSFWANCPPERFEKMLKDRDPKVLGFLEGSFKNCIKHLQKIQEDLRVSQKTKKI